MLSNKTTYFLNYIKILIKYNIKFFVDFFLIFLSTYFSFAIVDQKLNIIHFNLLYILISSQCIYLITSHFIGIYKSLIRFYSSNNFVTELKGLFFYSILFQLFLALNPRSGVPLAIGFFQTIFLLLFIYLKFLLFTKILFKHDLQIIKNKNVLIYGAGKLGFLLSESMMGFKDFKIKGFIDDDKYKHNKTVNNIKIYGRLSIPELILNEDIREVYVAINKISEHLRLEIFETFRVYPLVKIKFVPSYISTNPRNIYLSDFDDLDVKHLIGRSETAPIQSLLDKNTKDKVALVTGAGGSIGYEICSQLVNLQINTIVLLDHNEFALYQAQQKIFVKANLYRVKIEVVLGSILDYAFLDSVIKKYNPWIIFHAAAYKHVPIVENNKIQSIKNNIFGSYNVARCADVHNVANCLLISTDKAVSPKNMMGTSKRFAELIFQGFNKKSKTIFSVVRFGNVLNSSGSVIPLFKDQILSGGPVTVTHKNVTRYFMTLSEAALLVIQASSLSIGGEIFVLDMGKPLKILDIAKKMILIYGSNFDIQIKFIGLRKGEKMHEKLFIGKKIYKTDHPKIFKVIEPSFSLVRIHNLISRIRFHIDHDNYGKALNIINDLNIKKFNT